MLPKWPVLGAWPGAKPAMRWALSRQAIHRQRAASCRAAAGSGPAFLLLLPEGGVDGVALPAGLLPDRLGLLLLGGVDAWLVMGEGGGVKRVGTAAEEAGGAVRILCRVASTPPGRVRARKSAPEQGSTRTASLSRAFSTSSAADGDCDDGLGAAGCWGLLVAATEEDDEGEEEGQVCRCSTMPIRACTMLSPNTSSWMACMREQGDKCFVEVQPQSGQGEDKGNPLACSIPG